MLLWGIIGIILFPLIFFSFLSITQGTFSLNSLVLISQILFKPSLFFIYIYLSGFFIGAIIGYTIKKGVLYILKRKFWLLLAVIGLLFGSLYPWFFIGSNNPPQDKYAGIGFIIVLIFGPPICFILGALIGLVIQLLLVKSEDGRG